MLLVLLLGGQLGDIKNRNIRQPVFVMKMAGSAGSQRK